MTTTIRAAILFAAFVLSACSTPYQEDNLLTRTLGTPGGYRVTQVVDAMRKPIEGVWRVRYEGNNWTTADTVEVYGLYRCATFALEQGFEGFEVLPSSRMSFLPPDPRVQPAQFYYVPVPIIVFSVDIRLLKKPFAASPPMVFDAAALKASLEPHVMGEKCDQGNICPHEKDYLRPPPPPVPQEPTI